MDEPGTLVQVGSAKNVGFGWFGDPIRHSTMLPDERFEPSCGFNGGLPIALALQR